MSEVWKPVVGYEGLYEVSDEGRVKSYHRQPKLMSSGLNNKGYAIVKLCKNNRQTTKLVHRLVMESFSPSDGYFVVDHINEVKTDNRFDNLEWVTHEENTRRFYKRDLPKHVYKLPCDLYQVCRDFKRKSYAFGTFKSLEDATEKARLVATYKTPDGQGTGHAEEDTASP